MFNNVVMGQYVDGDSWIYRIDPRAKILFTIIFTTAIFFANHIIMYGIAVGFVILYIMSTRLPFKKVLRSLKPIMFILIITFVFNIFFTKSGTLLWEWGFLKIYQEGIIRAAFLCIRLLIIVSMASILTFTTTPAQLTLGLESLMKPLKIIKVPVEMLAMTISLALRFIPTILEETTRIMKAQTSRGATYDEGNILKKVRHLVSLLIPLFIMAFKRSDELSDAMEARGYEIGRFRTRLHVLKIKKLDFVYILLGLSLAAALIYLRFFYELPEIF